MDGRRRIRALLLCALLLLPCAAQAAPGWNPKSEPDARRQALSLFLYCAFHVEYAPPEPLLLSRWDQEINIWMGGSPTRQDRETLDSFLRELQEKVHGLPAIRRVREDRNANLRMWFIPTFSMGWYLENYVEGNQGFFSYKYDRQHRISSATILISSDDATQEVRNHLILEELTGALGLPGDHLKYEDSILYQKWTTVQQLSDVDWRMLNCLYDPRLRPGMSEQEAREALQKPV